MAQVYLHGWGAVTPGGWGMPAFRQALQKGQGISVREVTPPGWQKGLRIRRVPTPAARPIFMAHARMRRTSPIAQYAVAAALEALGPDTAAVASHSLRLGIVFCVFCGCVNYSRRFYDETLRDPSAASPLIFPETVFNAPSSHLAALLGTTAINYTLVGDPSTFLQGLALAAQWLDSEPIDGCLVVGAEELDWISADALNLFHRDVIVAEGSGALYLRKTIAPSPAVELRGITDAALFHNRATRRRAVSEMRAELPEGNENDLLCDSVQGAKSVDSSEVAAWNGWPGRTLSVKKIFGEGLMAAAAWQCVAAADALRQRQARSALVSVLGCNQQAMGAQFG